MGFIPYHMYVVFILYIYIVECLSHKMILTHMCYPQLTLLMPFADMSQPPSHGAEAPS